MAEGNRVLGWLSILNHTSGGEFGTVEASLVNSIGAILGIHSSNSRPVSRSRRSFWPASCGH